MISTPEAAQKAASLDNLSENFARVRGDTVRLCDSLAPEDMVVQSMPDVSPTKWHLAHVTWFFEKFVLEPFARTYQPFNERFHYLFNSYYYTAGDMHKRPQRGLLSRPTVAEVLQYREHVDAAVLELIADGGRDPAVDGRITLGLHHERQHQELLLTDIKHVFAQNPIQPAMNADLPVPEALAVADHRFVSGPEGILEIGATGNGFCFDNETPRHRVLLSEHSIGSRLITNREYRDFIRDGAYETSSLWLSDGWATVNERGWKRSLYWNDGLDEEFTLGGVRELDLSAPVSHISYYEADAYARWAGARLPTEAEWEVGARDHAIGGNFVEQGLWQPAASDGDAQFFGDVWEWTASPYSAYPGFKPLDGSLGEYNGKFMCNQMTVRGGSCVSAVDHIRASYRSFFYPDARWQYLGLRLARDGA